MLSVSLCLIHATCTKGFSISFTVQGKNIIMKKTSLWQFIIFKRFNILNRNVDISFAIFMDLFAALNNNRIFQLLFI